MKDYLKIFTSMADRVSRIPFLKLDDLSFSSGASEETIQSINKRIGFEMPREISHFFKQTNGLHFKWSISIDNTTMSMASLNKMFSPYLIEIPEDSGNPLAEISIINVEEIFSKDYFSFTETTIHSFAGVELPLSELSIRIKPFDFFSEFAAMAFYIDYESKSIQTLMLDSHYDDWYSSRICPFEFYMDMIIKSFGLVESRRTVYYQSQGHRLNTLTLEDIIQMDFIPEFLI